MFDVQAFISMAKRAGHEVTDAQVQAALTTIDQSAVKAKHKNKYTYEVWDKKSPINGVEASYFLSRPDVNPMGEIYLVKDTNGQTIFFQPNPPGVAGVAAMDKTNIHSYAKQHVDTHIDNSTNQEIMELMRTKLGIHI